LLILLLLRKNLLLYISWLIQVLSYPRVCAIIVVYNNVLIYYLLWLIRWHLFSGHLWLSATCWFQVFNIFHHWVPTFNVLGIYILVVLAKVFSKIVVWVRVWPVLRIWWFFLIFLILNIFLCFRILVQTPCFIKPNSKFLNVNQSFR
jgi:hypothetical protein